MLFRNKSNALIMLISALMIGLASFDCEDYPDVEIHSCQIRIINMSEEKINVCIVGHTKPTEEELCGTYIFPKYVEVFSGHNGRQVDIISTDKGNKTWKDFFSDKLDYLFVAIAKDEKPLTKWLNDADESGLLQLYKFSLEDLGANKKNKNIFYF